MLIEAQSLKHRAPRDGFLRTGEVESFRVDENGNVIKEPKPEPKPEPATELETFTIDKNGNLIKEETEPEVELDFEMVGFEDNYNKTG